MLRDKTLGQKIYIDKKKRLEALNVLFYPIVLRPNKFSDA
jgi:hypothetical protein